MVATSWLAWLQPAHPSYAYQIHMPMLFAVPTMVTIVGNATLSFATLCLLCTAPAVPPRVAAGSGHHRCRLQGVHGEGLLGGLQAAAVRHVAAAVLPGLAPAQGRCGRLQRLLDAAEGR
jgi:hypothetical protein